MSQLDLIATAPFGLESVVARELQALGFTDQQVQDGKVNFRGGLTDICRANLWLRSADRVLLRIGQFEAKDFGQLFDQTTALPWSEWLPVDAEFPVNGRSVRSQLHSVPHCQSIVKKAIVENLKRRYQRFQFPETGTLFPIEVALLKDQATLSIDTSGLGLHKRGYRQRTSGVAPLKETLAAALVQLSVWNSERPLVDPCCGTGTILIEAAMLGRNMAPGLKRTFVSEQWPQFSKRDWQQARSEARDLQKPSFGRPVMGYDIDERVLRDARQHAREAGVDNDLHLQQQPLAQLESSREYGCLITNPPYGERVGEGEQLDRLYQDLAALRERLSSWSFFVLTAYEQLEPCFGAPPTRRRKLYNGRIQCCYYQYLGPRPES